MDYKVRKNQLNNAVVNFIKRKGFEGKDYAVPLGLYFNAACYGVLHKEKLIALTLTDKDEVEVTTEYKESETIYTENTILTEFGNDEIVSIMEVLGIDIPKRK